MGLVTRKLLLMVSLEPGAPGACPVNANSSFQHPASIHAYSDATRAAVQVLARPLRGLALAVVICGALAACASSDRRDAPPESLAESAPPRSTTNAMSELASTQPRSSETRTASGDRRMMADPSSSRSASARSNRLRAAGSNRRKLAHRSVPMMASAPAQALAFSPRKLMPGEMAAHMIDVGQGDAVLLEFNCGAALIDTGVEWAGGSNSKQRLTDYLDMFFNRRRQDLNHAFDLVVISHGHADHANGIPLLLDPLALFGQVTIRNLVDSGYDTDGANFTAKHQIALRAAVLAAGGRAKSILVDDIDWYSGATSSVIDPFTGCPDEVDPEIAVLWGDWSNYASAPKNPNHHSVVTRLDFGESSFLFTGDIQTDKGDDGGLDVILKDYAADLSAFDVDVLKVAHHGAENGTTKALVEATTPCLAMMGVGDPTRFQPGTAGDHGHPRRSTLKLLQATSGGVTGTRPTRRIQAFESEHPPTVRTDIKRAIFGTAWDGHHVVYASADGVFEVVTEKGEQLAVACVL